MNTKKATPVWTIGDLDENSMNWFTQINRKNGRVPTGDTLRIGDEHSHTVYAVFTGKPDYDYWVDNGSFFESRSSCNDPMIIFKSDCKVQDGCESDE